LAEKVILSFLALPNPAAGEPNRWAAHTMRCAIFITFLFCGVARGNPVALALPAAKKEKGVSPGYCRILTWPSSLPL
jgi:hypothetical protein